MSDRTSWFDAEDDGWVHEAGYVPRTNVFRVKAASALLPLAVETADFAVPGEDFFVRRFTFANTGSEPVSFRFVYYSSFRSMETQFYHMTQFDEAQDTLAHIRHEHIFSASSSNVCAGYQAGAGAWDAAASGELGGNDIDMQPDGALLWRFEQLALGACVEVPVFIGAGATREAAFEALARAKSQPAQYWFDYTCGYWHRFLAAAHPAPAGSAEAQELYERSLLTMKLMSDERSGSVVAAPEFDERFSRCGGYAYCWGRDAAFITTAFDAAGLAHLSTRFYEWTLTAQDPDGSWQQRHYHDGRLAPSWGLQIDEGASILWGMWQHYLHIRDESFVRRVWPAARRAAAFLVGYLDEETGLPRPSRDLWEERLGEHTYSAVAVYGGLAAAASFAGLLGRGELAEAWSTAAGRVRQAIAERCWNEARGSFYRGLKLAVSAEAHREVASLGLPAFTETNAKGYVSYWLAVDPVIDVSLLGLSVPFGAFAWDDPRMEATADVIERELTSPLVGGIKRYEDDSYIGGNPWILTSYSCATTASAKAGTTRRSGFCNGRSTTLRTPACCPSKSTG